MTTLADKIKRLAQVAPDLAVALLPAPREIDVDAALLAALDRIRESSAVAGARGEEADHHDLAATNRRDIDVALSEFDRKLKLLVSQCPDLAGQLPADATEQQLDAVLREAGRRALGALPLVEGPVAAPAASLEVRIVSAQPAPGPPAAPPATAPPARGKRVFVAESLPGGKKRNYSR